MVDSVLQMSVLAVGAVTLLVIPAFLALHWRLRPPVRRWRARTLLWLVSAVLLGPFVVAASATVLGTLVRWRDVVADPVAWAGAALGGIVMVGMMWAFIGACFFALPYLPVLLLWARLGPRLGWLERTRAGVVVSSLLLAIPGASTTVLAYRLLDEQFGAAGLEAVGYAGSILAAITVCLSVPRLLFQPLRPGVFEATPEHRPSGAA